MRPNVSRSHSAPGNDLIDLAGLSPLESSESWRIPSSQGMHVRRCDASQHYQLREDHGYLANETTFLDSEGNPLAWEAVGVELLLPIATDFIVVEVAARGNLVKADPVQPDQNQRTAKGPGQASRGNPVPARHDVAPRRCCVSLARVRPSSRR